MKPLEPEIAPSATITKEQEWYREILVKLLGWGTAAFLTMAGWLISSDSKFHIRGSGDEHDRAWGLVVIAGVAWPFWAVLLHVIHRKIPACIPGWAITAYSAVLIVAALFIIWLTVKD